MKTEKCRRLFVHLKLLLMVSSTKTWKRGENLKTNNFRSENTPASVYAIFSYLIYCYSFVFIWSESFSSTFDFLNAELVVNAIFMFISLRASSSKSKSEDLFMEISVVFCLNLFRGLQKIPKNNATTHPLFYWIFGYPRTPWSHTFVGHPHIFLKVDVLFEWAHYVNSLKFETNFSLVSL